MAFLYANTSNLRVFGKIMTKYQDMKLLLMGIIRENLKIIREMVKEITYGIMGNFIRVNGKKG